MGHVMGTNTPRSAARSRGSAHTPRRRSRHPPLAAPTHTTEALLSVPFAAAALLQPLRVVQTLVPALPGTRGRAADATIHSPDVVKSLHLHTLATLHAGATNERQLVDWSHHRKEGEKDCMPLVHAQVTNGCASPSGGAFAASSCPPVCKTASSVNGHVAVPMEPEVRVRPGVPIRECTAMRAPTCQTGCNLPTGVAASEGASAANRSLSLRAFGRGTCTCSTNSTSGVRLIRPLTSRRAHAQHRYLPWRPT